MCISRFHYTLVSIYKNNKDNIMDTIKTIGQKVKGEAQMVKGKVEIATGQHVKGNVSKLRGRANVLEADLKMKK